MFFLSYACSNRCRPGAACRPWHHIALAWSYAPAMAPRHIGLELRRRSARMFASRRSRRLDLPHEAPPHGPPALRHRRRPDLLHDVATSKCDHAGPALPRLKVRPRRPRKAPHGRQSRPPPVKASHGRRSRPPPATAPPKPPATHALEAPPPAHKGAREILAPDIEAGGHAKWHNGLG